jgi:hypothetical protein
LGQEGECLVRARLGEGVHAGDDEGEIPEADPGHQFPQYGGLAEPLHDQPAHLGGQHEAGHGEQERSELGMLKAGGALAGSGQ